MHINVENKKILNCILNFIFNELLKNNNRILKIKSRKLGINVGCTPEKTRLSGKGVVCRVLVLGDNRHPYPTPEQTRFLSYAHNEQLF